MLEKHFIIDASIGGPDASFSMDEKHFGRMVEDIRIAEQSIGVVSYELTDKMKSGREFCRSLYVAEDMKVGDIITEENVLCKTRIWITSEVSKRNIRKKKSFRFNERRSFSA